MRIKIAKMQKNGNVNEGENMNDEDLRTSMAIMNDDGRYAP